MKIHPMQAAQIIEQEMEFDITLIPVGQVIADHGRQRVTWMVRSGWIDVEFIPGPGDYPNLFIRSDQLAIALAVPTDDA